MSNDDAEPEHLTATTSSDTTLAVDALQKRLDRCSTTGQRRRLLESSQVPQPYSRSPASIQAWEGRQRFYTAELADDVDGWELREDDTKREDGRWIQSTGKIRSLGDVR
jgi:hypothetical protein